MLQSKVIVVTGGAGVLGSVLVRCIVECGGTAVVADIDVAAAAREAKAVASACSGRAEAVRLDITDTKSIGALIADLSRRHGRIDAVVSTAYPHNSNYGRKLEDVTYKDFCENVDLHLGGYFLVAQQFGLFFRAQGAGNIINLSSIYGVMTPRFDVYAGTGMTMPVEYAAIKSAIVHLTRYFAQYFKGEGIRVNCVSPGGIRGNQPQDFLRKYDAFCNGTGMLEPRDITGALLFLLSDASKAITGQNIVVDDGYSL